MYVKKRLEVHQCLSNIRKRNGKGILYGKGILELPLNSLMEEYQYSKVRLQMTPETRSSAMQRYLC